MPEFEIMPHKIAEKKTLILQSRLDDCWINSRGEALKRSLVPKHRLFGPRTEDVSFLSSSKYYEPYIILGGKYSIDYCKRHVYAIEVNDETQKMNFGGEVFKCENSLSQISKTLKIAGEEHLHYENETYIVLDRFMMEVSPERFPLAPFESRLENSKESELDLRRAKMSLESEIDFLRSRIAKRPDDVSEIIRENFEITQRLQVYRPFYELAFQNIKNGKLCTTVMDGITGEMIVGNPNGAFDGITRFLNGIFGLRFHKVEGQPKSEAKSSQFHVSKTQSQIQPKPTQCNVPEKRGAHLTVQLTLGCFSLVLGLLAANFALFEWLIPPDSFFLLGEYARYACAYGGFGAIIFGAMLINDFLVSRSKRTKVQSNAESIEEAESDKEHVEFIVPGLEEERKADAQKSSKP